MSKSKIVLSLVALVALLGIQGYITMFAPAFREMMQRPANPLDIMIGFIAGMMLAIVFFLTPVLWPLRKKKMNLIGGSGGDGGL